MTAQIFTWKDPSPDKGPHLEIRVHTIFGWSGMEFSDNFAPRDSMIRNYYKNN